MKKKLNLSELLSEDEDFSRLAFMEEQMTFYTLSSDEITPERLSYYLGLLKESPDFFFYKPMQSDDLKKTMGTGII